MFIFKAPPNKWKKNYSFIPFIQFPGPFGEGTQVRIDIYIYVFYSIYSIFKASARIKKINIYCIVRIYFISFILYSGRRIDNSKKHIYLIYSAAEALRIKLYIYDYICIFILFIYLIYSGGSFGHKETNNIE